MPLAFTPHLPEDRLDAYVTLDPLQTRIDTHREYSEHPDDVEADTADHLALPPGASLLDVGCGTGTFFGHLRERGHTGRFVGVDSSPAALERITGQGQASAVLADAMDLPFPDASFDAVTARHMLYHVPDPDRALWEARRVTRPGGRVLAAVNHGAGLPRLASMVREVVEGLGVDAPDYRGLTSSEDLPGRMREVFAEVSVTRRDNALVFTEPGPVVRYAVSVLALYGLPPRAEGYAEAVAELELRTRRWFEENQGPWRDPKGYSVCVSERR